MRSPIERASANDMVTFATDCGPAPTNIGAVLILEQGSGLDFSTVTATLADRLPRVRRLRQRLVPTPLGGGRPVWLDSPDFDLGRHVSTTDLSVPTVPAADSDNASDEQLLELVADLVCTPLDPHRPLWAVRWVTGLPDNRAALVLVMHHALTDGVGGLAILGALADGGADPGSDTFPEPPPRLRSVVGDAWRARATALTQLPRRLRAGRQGLRELGIRAGRPTVAVATSLNRPTGPRRRLTVVRVPLGPLLESAHRRTSTLNDLMLTAVTGAMAGVLRLRGERPDELVVSVPVSARRTATVAHLGNQTGVAPLAIPTLADQGERLRCITAMSSARRAAARGTSAGPMGLVFRVLGALRLFKPFIDHQRLVHTFVTNVRGPETVARLAGHPIVEIVPVAVTPGNVGVCFDILSYAGGLVMTVVADPDVVPEQDLLTSLLTEELDRLLR